jgi:homoserine kinase
MSFSKLLKYHYSKVFAPATISNAGPGFDTFGFALDRLGDVIEVKATKELGVRISDITGDNGKLSRNFKRNTASVAALSLLNGIEADFGIDMIINKRMPFASGLGSSAASAVAAAIAVNSLLKDKLEDDKVLLHALDGEQIASAGNIHADNVAPAFYGGFTIVRSLTPVDIINLPFPQSITCLIIYPHIAITTKESRKVLPKQVPIGTAVKQSANAGALIAGILTNDNNLISRSMIDSIAEPYRVKLIPHYDELRSLLLEHGPLNFNISGSGPTVFSFFESIEKADRAKMQILIQLIEMKMDADVFLSKINLKGPEQLELVK